MSVERFKFNKFYEFGDLRKLFVRTVTKHLNDFTREIVEEMEENKRIKKREKSE